MAAAKRHAPTTSNTDHAGSGRPGRDRKSKYREDRVAVASHASDIGVRAGRAYSLVEISPPAARRERQRGADLAAVIAMRGWPAGPARIVSYRKSPGSGTRRAAFTSRCGIGGAPSALRRSARAFCGSGMWGVRNLRRCSDGEHTDFYGGTRA